MNKNIRTNCSFLKFIIFEEDVFRLFTGVERGKIRYGSQIFFLCLTLVTRLASHKALILFIVFVLRPLRSMSDAKNIRYWRTVVEKRFAQVRGQFGVSPMSYSSKFLLRIMGLGCRDLARY